MKQLNLYESGFTRAPTQPAYDPQPGDPPLPQPPPADQMPPPPPPPALPRSPPKSPPAQSSSMPPPPSPPRSPLRPANSPAPVEQITNHQPPWDDDFVWDPSEFAPMEPLAVDVNAGVEDNQNEPQRKEKRNATEQGQVAHRFVNNFHIHHGDERTVCGHCGEEKSCPQCSSIRKKQCEICGIWLSSKHTSGVYHQQVHLRQRTYKCAQCLDAFTRKGILIIHMRIHTGAKPYLCEICGLLFRQRSELTYHQASVHSDKRPYECDSCGNTFKLRYQLMRHKRGVHKFVYMCPECKEVFGTRNEFSAHHSAIHVKGRAHWFSTAKAGLLNESAEMEHQPDDKSENG